MKNLKRALSLVLATVMVIGMMVVGASAANYNDFTDKGEIVNAEAVALLNDLGIIEGVGDGSYAPTATIDRAGMAKLITKIMMGNVPASAFEGTTTDLTDINGHWAEGYIKYCYSMGFIAGNGDGTFNPNGTINVVGAAKLLATALGYDAAKQGYVNDSNWSVNVMKDATTSGLLNGITASAQAPLTRDMAAQMIYNALFAKQVYYLTLTNDTVLYKDNTLGLATYGLVKFDGVVTGVTADSVSMLNAVPSYANNAAIVAAGRTFDIHGRWEDVGVAGTVYAKYATETVTSNFSSSVRAKTAGFEKVYSTSVVPSDMALKTVHDGTKLADMTNPNKSVYVAGLDARLTVVVNGVVRGDFNDTNVDGTYDKNGIIRTLLDNDGNGKIDTMVITEYTTAKVTSVSTANEYLTLTRLTGDTRVAAKWDFDDVVGYENLAKNDYVTAMVFGNTLYVKKAEAITGDVTKFISKDTAWTIGGVNYKASGRQYKITPITSDMVVGDEMTVYVDANDYIVAAGPVATATNYLYVTANDQNGVDGDRARVTFTDGTSAVVTYNMSTGSIANDTVYTYSVGTNGVYTLTAVASTNYMDIGATSNVHYKLTNGSNKITYTKDADPTAVIDDWHARLTTETIVVDVANGRAYTGYHNMPTLTDCVGDVVYSNGLASIIFLKSATPADAANGDTFYLYNANYVKVKVDDNYFYQYTVLRNGVPDDIVVYTQLSTKGLYTITTVDAAGRVTGLTSTTPATATKPVITCSATTMVVGNQWTEVNTWIIDDETTFYIVNHTTGTYMPATVDHVIVNDPANAIVGSNVMIEKVANTNNTADIVYIVQ